MKNVVMDCTELNCKEECRHGRVVIVDAETVGIGANCWIFTTKLFNELAELSNVVLA